VVGIPASMSMTLDMLAGMASYVGRSTTGAAAVGAGSDAAIAAAIEVAIFVGPFLGGSELGQFVLGNLILPFRPQRGISMNDWLRGGLQWAISTLDICIMSLPPELMSECGGVRCLYFWSTTATEESTLIDV